MCKSLWHQIIKMLSVTAVTIIEDMYVSVVAHSSVEGPNKWKPQHKLHLSAICDGCLIHLKIMIVAGKPCIISTVMTTTTSLTLMIASVGKTVMVRETSRRTRN